MSCIGVIQSSLIKSQGKSNWWFYYQLFRQILTISTILLLLDKGVNFIVMVMALQIVLLWPVTLVMVSRIVNLKVLTYFRQFLEPFLASVMMVMAVLLITYFMQEDSPIVRLLAEIMIGGIVYALSIFYLSKEKILLIIKSLLEKKNRKSNG